jgi:hypothetical protein
MVKWFTLMIILIGSASFGAVWEDQAITIIGSAPSTESNMIRFTLRDAQDQTFDAHYQTLPAKDTVTRIIKFKDALFAWKQIKISQLEFFVRADTLFVSMHVDSISYNKKDLIKYLPAGLAFEVTSEGVQYRFRTVIDNNSLRPKGILTDEESFLRDLSSIIEKQTEEIRAGLVNNDQPPLSVNIKARGNYLIPIGIFKNKFNYGYGGLLSLSLRNLGLSYQNKNLFLLEISALSGIWVLNPKKTDPITDVTDVQGYIIPINLSLGCPINFSKNFAVIPSVSAGYNYNRLSYTNLQGSKVQASGFLPSFMAELNIEYTRWHVPFHLGGGYIFMLEKSHTLSMFTINGGAGYVF